MKPGLSVLALIADDTSSRWSDCAKDCAVNSYKSVEPCDLLCRQQSQWWSMPRLHGVGGPILEFSLGRVKEEAEEGDDGVGPGLAMLVESSWFPFDAMALWLFYTDLQK